MSKPTTVIGSLTTGMLVCCLLIAFSIASSFAIISGAKETYDVVVLNGALELMRTSQYLTLNR